MKYETVGSQCPQGQRKIRPQFIYTKLDAFWKAKVDQRVWKRKFRSKVMASVFAFIGYSLLAILYTNLHSFSVVHNKLTNLTANFKRPARFCLFICSVNIYRNVVGNCENPFYPEFF
jgi:hypothetical protein